MDEATNLLLRFRGRLWENMVFERAPGWETDRVERRPIEGDGEYVLELLGAEGEVLVAVHPDVDFYRTTTIGPSEMLWADIVAYVPTRDEGRELVFRRGELVLHREDVPPDPPQIEIEGVRDIEEGRIEVRWRAQQAGDRPLSFDLLYIMDRERAFYIARGVRETSYEADLNSFPGSPQAQIAVLASDGTRSAFAVTDPFEVQEKPPLVLIQSPSPDETLPADQPVTLAGHATDAAGATLPSEHLVWQVDGGEIERGVELAMAAGLEPGSHEIVLRYTGPGELANEQRIAVTIAERSPEQEQFLELGRTLDPRSKQP